MSNDPEPRPLECPNPEVCARLRQVFERAGYTEERICEVLHIRHLSCLRDNGNLPLLHFTRGGSPLDTLLRLFLIGVPVELAALGRAVEPSSVTDWVEAGLVQGDGSAAVAPLRLMPQQGLIVASDPGWPMKAPLRFDHVAGISITSQKLADHTIRRHAAAALDLGTGCGIQALLAAAHSDRVTAIDRNPRAVRFASFNARVNGLTHVACHEGNWFEPVQGQRFDLVVGNPPFIVSPETRLQLRDSGLPRDDICRNLVREAPQFLTEGGFCQLLCNWIHVRGEDWRTRLRRWFEHSGCDVWVMLGKTEEPALYAASWIQQFETEPPERVQERFDRWMEYYERERIEAISYGMIVLRRRSGRANWVRLEEAPDMIGACGDATLRGFALRDFLEKVGDDSDLLKTALRPAPEARLHNRFQPASEGWTLEESRLRLSTGLAFGGAVSPQLLALLQACCGPRPLNAILLDLAATLGRPAAEVTAACIPIVRRLVEEGLLMPDESGVK